MHAEFTWYGMLLCSIIGLAQPLAIATIILSFGRRSELVRLLGMANAACAVLIVFLAAYGAISDLGSEVNMPVDSIIFGLMFVPLPAIAAWRALRKKRA
jgi:hypothetical protein